jgi:hypothetical protein
MAKYEGGALPMGDVLRRKVCGRYEGVRCAHVGGRISSQHAPRDQEVKEMSKVK